MRYCKLFSMVRKAVKRKHFTRKKLKIISKIIKPDTNRIRIQITISLDTPAANLFGKIK